MYESGNYMRVFKVTGKTIERQDVQLGSLRALGSSQVVVWTKHICWNGRCEVTSKLVLIRASQSQYSRYWGWEHSSLVLDIN
jgi:hypothetical protein